MTGTGIFPATPGPVPPRSWGSLCYIPQGALSPAPETGPSGSLLLPWPPQRSGSPLKPGLDPPPHQEVNPRTGKCPAPRWKLRTTVLILDTEHLQFACTCAATVPTGRGRRHSSISSHLQTVLGSLPHLPLQANFLWELILPSPEADPAQGSSPPQKRLCRC